MLGPQVHNTSDSKDDSTTRLETFSDGVFAIIVTLLVLDLRVPRETTLGAGALAAALRAMWPNYVAFAVSFCVTTVVWANHHAMFRHIRRVNQSLIVLNALLLLCVAVLPFTSALLAEYIRGSRGDQRLAAQVYAGALVVGGVFFNLLWWYAVRAGLCGSRRDADALREVGRHWVWGPALYTVAFVLSWVSVPLSLVLYAALILWFGISGPWLASRLARATAHETPAEPVATAPTRSGIEALGSDDAATVTAELTRLGIRSHDEERVWSFASMDVPPRELIRRLRTLPDGAGHEAAIKALGASS